MPKTHASTEAFIPITSGGIITVQPYITTTFGYNDLAVSGNFTIYCGIYPDTSHSLGSGGITYFSSLNGLSIASYATSCTSSGWDDKNLFIKWVGVANPNSIAFEFYSQFRKNTSWYGDGDNITTRILQPYIPADGAFASTTTQAFSYQFYFNSSTSYGIVDTATVEIKNLTDPTAITTISKQTIIASGISTYTATTTLQSGSSYLWRPILQSSTGTSTPITGAWYSFQATSTPAYTPYTPYTPPAGTISTSTNPIPLAPCGILDVSGCFQNAISYLFYPTIDPTNSFISVDWQHHAPFVYIYQIGQIRNALFTASSTANTAITIDLWKIGNNATSTITLISKSMIENVPFSGTIYNVIKWLLWLAMAEYIYFRVTRIHDTSTPK